ncbi:hypothetical protein QPK87_06620 [Kamptonema cortianum]|nr:hypothetical protein [Geitlerinema splendidum]MDK3156246.1 hypothetical protein [Kamptonema cortianum]
MGALRKSEQWAPAPMGEVIVLPRPAEGGKINDGPGLWARFKESELGSVLLFEARMFSVVIVGAGLVFAIAGGFYSAKSAAGIDLNPEYSLSNTADYFAGPAQPHTFVGR